ncbi:LysM peptidoglycan-binding domain-containing protein [Desulfuribacillus alkaliarsenatis]|uniref:LysM domain-containing protein n=1 Tax=Desulfuribacillus alkaliarsenatis TaxID=766136 RepID=A0A1E5FYY9_9FIRM|nr:LysM domain-containing protein [Desulfuribacillus alkaliarsenatis]OEF95657.1 hypothetical protein BHF68_12505 [Desulfuribacillus alkaliarsenatis]
MDHKHMKPYVVKPGDTMFKIARRYNLPLDVLIAANPQIPNPDLIYPGQVIMVPVHQHDHCKDYKQRHHHHHPCHPHPTPKPSPYPCLPSGVPRFRSGFMPRPMPTPQPGEYPSWWMNPPHEYGEWGQPNPWQDWGMDDYWGDWQYEWDNNWNNPRHTTCDKADK